MDQSIEEDTLSEISSAYAVASRTRGPKYLALRRAIEALVSSGRLAYGAQLPSDEQLTRLVGLSLGTVQSAMKSMSQDGVLNRRHGAGTFVCDPSEDMRNVWHFRFKADDGGLLPLKARAVEKSTLNEEGPWSDYLVGATEFVRIRRMISVAQEFEIFSEFYFDACRFPQLVELDLSAFDRIVLRSIMPEVLGISVTIRSQMLCLAKPSPEQVRFLEGCQDASCMKLETFGEDSDRCPAYYQQVIIPPTDRKLIVSDGEARH